jgi:signal transduction histidine kinase
MPSDTRARDLAERVEELEQQVRHYRDLHEVLRGRLHFERMICDLSAAFVNLPPDRVDEAIEDALKRLVEFLGVDRSTLAEFAENDTKLIVTHYYSVPGIDPPPRGAIDNMFPWLTAKLRRGEVLNVHHVSDLPDEAGAEKAYAYRVGQKSNLTIPLPVGGEKLCALALGTFRAERDWPAELIQRVRLVGEVFANALARRRAHEARKLGEERAQRLREELTRVARVTTLGELAASIAHEVNQPLCAIVSNAQAALHFLAADEPDLAETRAALADVIAEGKRAGEIIQRIRAFLKRSPPRRKRLDVNEVIRGAALLGERQLANRRTALRLELAAGLPPVLGDAVQLQQVLLNLLINGSESMSGLEDAPRELTILSSRPDPATVAVAVRDAGRGIAADALERVFEPFWTTKPDGLGLGLSISRSIIEVHGGRLWAATNPDRGTTVHFTLPVAGEGAP